MQTYAHKKQAGRHTKDIPQKTSKLYLLEENHEKRDSRGIL